MSTERVVEVSRTFPALGTFATVVVTVDQGQSDFVLRKADSLLRYLDTKLGRFSTDGELFHLNTSLGISTDTELAHLVFVSDSIVKATGNWFDPSIGAVSDVWGFPEATEVPDSSAVQKALDCTGWNTRVHLYPDTVFIDENTVLDFGAIAKGYSVDRVYSMLMQMGAVECLVEVGGEIRCGGTTGRVWNIGIRHPRTEELAGVLQLTEGAVATSGDYECCFFENGVRYSHIIDYKTGYPSRNAASATVVAGDCTTADAVATAAAAAGPDGASRFPEQLYTSILIITENRDGRCENHELGEIPWAEQ